jgi:hypothetical protein
MANSASTILHPVGGEHRDDIALVQAQPGERVGEPVAAAVDRPESSSADRVSLQ